MINFVLVLLLAGLVVTYLMRQKNPELSKLVMIVLVALTFVTLLVRMGRRDRPERELRRTMMQFSDAVAQQMGEHIAAALPQGGTLVFLQAMPDHERDRARLQNLGRGAGNAFRVVAVQPTPPGSLEDEELAMMDLFDETVLPVQAFAEVMEQHPDAVGIVSTRWVPFLRGREQLPANMPPLFVLEAGEEPEMMVDMLRRGVVQAFVSVRRDAQWTRTPERGMSAADIFNLRYMLVTRENARELQRFIEEY